MRKVCGYLMVLLMLWMVLFVICVFAFPQAFAAAEERGVMQEIYVSCVGSDSGSGTKLSPYKTIAKAQSEVRKINAAMTGDIVVYIADGTYELSGPIAFTKEDSGTNGFKVRYVAQNGAGPVISGGKKINGNWTNEGGGIYSISLNRSEKLRSLYVNGERRFMTSAKASGQGKNGTYSITAGSQPWAWISGSVAAGVKFNNGAIPLDTRNQDDIEIMTQTTWNTAIVCVEKLERISDSQFAAKLQMPYGAIAQQPGWNNAYKFTGTQTVYNVFEWLTEGEFYFDKTEKKLYYYPEASEDLSSAEVVVPELETLITITGENKSRHVQNIEFEGLTFAYTDWQLYNIGGSHGRATIQGSTGMIAFSESNWHHSIYRAYDVGPAAIMLSSADNINFYNNNIRNLGNEGLSLINDVSDCVVDGNIFYDSAGSAALIGHPQHSYIGDKGSNYGKLSDKEKYDAGVEGVCKDITFTNNYIYGTSRLFWGDAALMAFYTEGFLMKHNHIENTPYNGLSIGWGWWNMNGDSDSVVPGIPSTTTKNNTIESNTFVKCMQTLGDAGAIYTLGDMPGTVIRGNYITNTGNPSLTQHIVRGIHPDEGSRHIYATDNLIEKMAKSNMAIIDTHYWGRKGYNTWHNVYTDNDLFTTDESGAYEPGTVVTKIVRPERIWGDDVFEIVTNSDIESKYFSRIPAKIFRLQDRLLGTNFFAASGKKLDFKFSDADIDAEVWLAPEGTVRFGAGSNMTKAKDGVIYTPADDGEYRLFIVKGSEVSEPSAGRIIVYSGSLASNITDNGVYRVSKEKPLDLGLKSEYIDVLYLNGKEIDKNSQIESEGTQELEIIDLSGAKKTYTFSTYTDEVDKVFTTSICAIDGAVGLNPSEKEAWFVPESMELSDASKLLEGKSMTKAERSSMSISVPENIGRYRLALSDGVNISRKSDAVLEVVTGGLDVTNGLVLRLDANEIEGGLGSRISRWRASVGNYEIEQDTESARPTLGETERGMRYLEFDAVDDCLELKSSQIDLNGKKNLTMIILSAYTAEDPTLNSNGDTSAALYFGETGSWGSILLSPYKSLVMARFGSGQSNNVIKYTRAESTDDFSVTAAVKDGKNEILYEDAVAVVTLNDRYEITARNKTSFAIGKTAAAKTTYFGGKVAEVLIYDRSLTASEIENIQRYMEIKKSAANVNKAIVQGDVIIQKGASGYNPLSWQNFLTAHDALKKVRNDILNSEDVSSEMINAAIKNCSDSIAFLGDDSLAAQSDADAIEIPQIVREDVTLVYTGELGSRISWQADIPGMVDANGKIKRPEEGEAAVSLTLTANVEFGSAKIEKKFNVKVAPKVSAASIWKSTADYSLRTFGAIKDGAVTFDITANELSDGFVGLCGNITPSKWGDYSIVFRIRPEGYMDAMNGSSFAYTQRLEYEVGKTYHVRIVTDADKKTFSVYVTDEQDNTYTVADNFAYRASAPVIDSVAKITVRGGSGVAANKFSISSFRTEGQTRGEIVNVTVSSDKLAYLYTSDVALSNTHLIAGYGSGGELIKVKPYTASLGRGETEKIEMEFIDSCSSYSIFVWSINSVMPIALSKTVAAQI
ncbi:MAG: right-handed parallel beta-helix repeat-containing protein [Clostridia bacterium]|nr:right-handed parallel beta-helix repeat-containing protein [Clostridia bacterium]